MSDDFFSFRAAGEAENASYAASKAAHIADKNLDASIVLLQMCNDIHTMVGEMRNWETKRFNDVADAFHLVYTKIDEQNREIQDLKAQVAGLQKKLYQEEKSSTPLKAMAR